MIDVGAFNSEVSQACFKSPLGRTAPQAALKPLPYSSEDAVSFALVRCALHLLSAACTTVICGVPSYSGPLSFFQEYFAVGSGMSVRHLSTAFGGVATRRGFSHVHFARRAHGLCAIHGDSYLDLDRRWGVG